jgi:TetR/AcrR family transcriptional regulator
MANLDQDILDAAMSVFGKEGYTGATTRMIAKTAGVNEVTLFRKFGSKDNILRAVITSTRDSALKTLDSIFLAETDADLSSCLSDLGRAFMRFVKERTDMIILLIAEGRRRPSVAKVLSSIPQAMIGRLSEYFEEQIRQGKIREINPQIAASAFLGYLFYNNLVRSTPAHKVLANGEKALDDFIDILTKGILKE